MVLGGKQIEYSVTKGRSSRYTYFRFKEDLSLEVALPRGRKVDVEAEIMAKRSWIVSESARIAASKSVLGESHVMYGGVAQKLVFVQGPKEELVRDPVLNEVTIFSSERRGIKEHVRRWFLKETSAYVVKKVAELAPIMGVRPSKVDVREIGKWGYCTFGGRISFSWQLISLPERLREYVIFHELAHLAVFNHSAAFRRKLKTVCPDHRDREEELDRYLPYSRLGRPG